MDGVWPGVRRGSAPFVRFRLGVREPGMANWKMDNWSKILSKMGQKIRPKFVQNLSEMDRKWIKNGSKMD